MSLTDIATAIKDRGAEWYYPAIKTAFGPKRLPHGDRHPTRYLAVKEAKRLLEETQERTGGEQ